MANAMLQDDFKTSHPDLVNYHHEEVVQEDEHRKSTDASILLSSPSSSIHKDSLPLSKRTKSVDFCIQAPLSKRARKEIPWTAKQVVDAISTSISPQERVEAITKTLEAFDHDVTSLHDEELAVGADAALTKHLTFLVWHTRNLWEQVGHDGVVGGMVHELSLTLSAMEAMYRASSDRVEVSFRRMGRDLLNLLVTMIEAELGRRSARVTKCVSDNDDTNILGGDNEKNRASSLGNGLPLGGDTATPTSTCDDIMVTPGSVDGDILLRKATKILGHFARIGTATKPLAHFPGLLSNLIQLINMQPYECVPWEARLSALWTIANLACHDENMIMMVCTSGLVGAIVQVASRPLHTTDSLETTMEVLRSRGTASRAILNLSWAAENKIVLAEHAALVDLLCDLSVQREPPLPRSKTVQEIVVNTRRHAMGALRNLAAAPRMYKIALCDYQNGRLLDVLTDAALNDADAGTKHRAFAAIHNLAIHDTAEKIAMHPDLVLALKNMLLTDDNDDAETEEGTSKSHASSTLLVLERTITRNMDSYEYLRDLFEAVNANEDGNQSSKSKGDQTTSTAEV